MSLLTLKTNLKSVPFGKDQPGSGNSGLPYIKTPLPENSVGTERIALESARFSADYPIRGGLYSVRAAAEDTIRISKFLTDFPKGSNFTSKQVGLQKSNPLIETGRNGGRINTQTYNLNANLITQVSLSGTGIHIPRSGANANTLLNDQNKYSYIVPRKETNNNRLVSLYNLKILKNTLTNNQVISNLGLSSDPSLLFDYVGGPNSFYGLGNTIIQRPTDNKGVPVNTNDAPKTTPIRLSEPLSLSVLGLSRLLPKLDPSLTGDKLNNKIGIFEQNNIVVDNITNKDRESNTFKKFSYVMNYDNIIKQEPYNLTGKIEDYRTKVDTSGSVFSRDYTRSDVNIVSRVGIGNPGARPMNRRIKINDSFSDGQDKVNMIPIITRDYNIAPELEDNARDLIKFNFETISNDNLNLTTRTHFRAFLKGFNDSNTSEWSGKRYAGRGEDFFNYQGFNRSISFNFTISAQSREEMKPLWTKLNYLVSTLYPDYSPDQGFMRGNITRLTIGEYLYRTPGILKSLTLTVDDNYPWEIKMTQPENGDDTNMMELPQLINVNCVFVPILYKLPRMGETTPIIMTDLVNNNFIKG